jgi:uncharacterized protein (DUF1499 family)
VRNRGLTPILLVLAACSAPGSRPGSLVDGHFAPCPSAPRCASSQDTDDRHAIAPFALTSGIAEAWPKIVQAVRSMPRTKIVEQYNYVVHAEVDSRSHLFTDDLELFWDPAASRVQIRSSARIGYYDYDVNRERIDKLRRTLVEAGVVAS